MQPLRGILWLSSIFGVALATALMALPGAGAGRNSAIAPEEIAPPVTTMAFQTIGSRTCASTACHGSVHPDPRSLGIDATHIRRDEYVFWTDHDPHARSLRTLESERSQRMFRELGIKNEQNEIVDQQGYNNCLQCHATTYTNPITKITEVESISCEACHGPAESWREKHYQRGWSPAVAANSGFADTKSLTSRAQQCVQCHVGAADREVNHDLIAAGHPALKFELAAYHDLLPKHWNDAQERARTADFERQLWSTGQRQTMQQALALLEARLARQVDSHPRHAELTQESPVKPVWPEFAEFDCFACHHQLADASWYRPNAKDPRSLAQWSTWNFALVSADKAPQLDKLRSAMEASWRFPAPNLAAQLTTAQSEIAALEAAPLHLSAEQAGTHWDRAAQAYLLLAAEFRTRQDAARQAGMPWVAETSTKEQLLKLRRALAFRPQHDSPDVTEGHSRAEILELLRNLEQQLAP